MRITGLTGLALLAGFMTATPDVRQSSRSASIAMDADSLLPARDLAKGQYGGPSGRLERLITNRPEVEAVWPSAPSLELDFEREILVLVALGEQRTGGYSAEVEAVRLTAGRLVIEYVELRPDPRCPTPQVITTPYHAVAIPRSEAKPRFERRVNIIDC